MTPLDKAVIAYREDPSPVNRERLLQAQREHVESFYARCAEEFVARTSMSNEGNRNA